MNRIIRKRKKLLLILFMLLLAAGIIGLLIYEDPIKKEQQETYNHLIDAAMNYGGVIITDNMGNDVTKTAFPVIEELYSTKKYKKIGQYLIQNEYTFWGIDNSMHIN